MRYKIGDKIVINDDLRVGDDDYEYGIAEEMDKLLESQGNVLTVTYVDEDSYELNRLYGYGWTDDMIEHEKTRELNRKLKEENTPNKLYQLFEYYTKKENQSDKFKDSFNNIYHYEFNCIYVNDIEITNEIYSDDIFTTDIKPHKEVKKMTVEEIEKELGYAIEIVK